MVEICSEIAYFAGNWASQSMSILPHVQRFCWQAVGALDALASCFYVTELVASRRCDVLLVKPKANCWTIEACVLVRSSEDLVSSSVSIFVSEAEISASDFTVSFGFCADHLGVSASHKSRLH